MWYPDNKYQHCFWLQMNQKLFIANTSEKKKFFEKDWYFGCQICFRSSDYQHLSCFNSLMSCLENMSFINHLTTLHYRALVISNAVTTFMGRKDIISGNNVSVSAPHILIADSAGSQGFCGSLLDLHLCFHRLQTSHRRAWCELHPNSWSAWWRDSLPFNWEVLWLCHPAPQRSAAPCLQVHSIPGENITIYNNESWL